MATSTIDGLLEHIGPAQEFLRANFGLDAITARGVVEDVLLGLMRNGPEKLRRHRRFFFHACRIRAFQILRSRRRQDKALTVVEPRRKQAESKDREVLVALEDEDKPKFFGQAMPKNTEALTVVLKRDDSSEVTATLETSESTLRMRIHVARKNPKHLAG